MTIIQPCERCRIALRKTTTKTNRTSNKTLMTELHIAFEWRCRNSAFLVEQTMKNAWKMKSRQWMVGMSHDMRFIWVCWARLRKTFIISAQSSFFTQDFPTWAFCQEKSPILRNTNSQYRTWRTSHRTAHLAVIRWCLSNIMLLSRWINLFSFCLVEN